jgi:hypothetical protein
MKDPLQEFVSGFSSTPVEVALATAFILLFVLFFLILFVRQRKAERLRRAAEEERRYREHLQSASLTSLDRANIEELASRVQVAAYRLFEEQGVFNRAAKVAREEGVLERAQIAALRVKLGFAGTMVGSRPSSSTEIPPDAGVEITDRRGRSFSARVLSPTTAAFRVEPEPGSYQPPTGSPLKVVYESGGGIFSFTSHLLRFEEGIMELEHSEDLKGQQRREHARRPVEVAVELERLDEGGDRYSSVTIDIGGGGATILNPQAIFREKDELMVSLYFPKQEALHLRAKVIRTSHEGELLHLRWVAIPEADRDRIYGFLFRAGAVR